MAEDEKTSISEAVDSVIQKIKDLPAAQDLNVETSAPSPSPSSRDRLFARERSLHELLGGGRGADIILWRRPKETAVILAGVTLVYITFEWLGCHVLSVLSKGSLVVLGVLFLWSNLATLVKRSPPNVPRPQLSEEKAVHLARVLKDQVNLIVDMIHEVVLGKDIRLFLKVELVLWVLAMVGKWADFLTLVYLSVLLLLSVPALYERHEDKVDRALKKSFEQTKALHVKLQDKVLSRVPQLAPKEKKTQ